MSNLIDRQAAIEVASEECFELRGVFGRIEDGLNALPTVEAIPIKDIKDFLRCEKIDSCDWRNCSECSQMKCISI